MDRPIIDPHFDASSELIEKKMKLSDFVSQGIIITRIVKRIVGNMFIQNLSQSFPEQRAIFESSTNISVQKNSNKRYLFCPKIFLCYRNLYI